MNGAWVRCRVWYASGRAWDQGQTEAPKLNFLGEDSGGIRGMIRGMIWGCLGGICAAVWAAVCGAVGSTQYRPRIDPESTQNRPESTQNPGDPPPWGAWGVPMNICNF